MRTRSVRVLLISLLTFATLGLSAAPALAGGWAVASLDSLPAELHAGQTYTIGYTLLQHGISPFQTQDSAIRVTAPGGETTSFAGKAQGAPGHYVAEVRFPSGGVWQWAVLPGPFAPQSLGSVTVLEASGPDGSQASEPAGAAATFRTSTAVTAPVPAQREASLSAMQRLALPAATLCAGALFALQLFEQFRRRRTVAPGTTATAVVPDTVRHAA